MKIIYPLIQLEIPIDIAQANGPFEEFKQDVSIVTVTLSNGTVYERVLVLYPNYVIAVADSEMLPFKPSEVVVVHQGSKESCRFKDFNWVFWYDPNELSKNA